MITEEYIKELLEAMETAHKEWVENAKNFTVVRIDFPAIKDAVKTEGEKQEELSFDGILMQCFTILINRLHEPRYADGGDYRYQNYLRTYLPLLIFVLKQYRVENDCYNADEFASELVVAQCGQSATANLAFWKSWYLQRLEIHTFPGLIAYFYGDSVDCFRALHQGLFNVLTEDYFEEVMSFLVPNAYHYNDNKKLLDKYRNDPESHWQQYETYALVWEQMLRWSVNLYFGNEKSNNNNNNNSNKPIINWLNALAKLDAKFKHPNKLSPTKLLLRFAMFFPQHAPEVLQCTATDLLPLVTTNTPDGLTAEAQALLVSQAVLLKDEFVALLTSDTQGNSNIDDALLSALNGVQSDEDNCPLVKIIKHKKHKWDFLHTPDSIGRVKEKAKLRSQQKEIVDFAEQLTGEQLNLQNWLDAFFANTPARQAEVLTKITELNDNNQVLANNMASLAALIETTLNYIPHNPTEMQCRFEFMRFCFDNNFITLAASFNDTNKFVDLAYHYSDFTIRVSDLELAKAKVVLAYCVPFFVDAKKTLELPLSAEKLGMCLNKMTQAQSDRINVHKTKQLLQLYFLSYPDSLEDLFQLFSAEEIESNSNNKTKEDNSNNTAKETVALTNSERDFILSSFANPVMQHCLTNYLVSLSEQRGQSNSKFEIYAQALLSQGKTTQSGADLKSLFLISDEKSNNTNRTQMTSIRQFNRILQLHLESDPIYIALMYVDKLNHNYSWSVRFGRSSESSMIRKIIDVKLLKTVMDRQTAFIKVFSRLLAAYYKSLHPNTSTNGQKGFDTGVAIPALHSAEFLAARRALTLEDDDYKDFFITAEEAKDYDELYSSAFYNCSYLSESSDHDGLTALRTNTFKILVSSNIKNVFFSSLLAANLLHLGVSLPDKMEGNDIRIAWWQCLLHATPINEVNLDFETRSFLIDKSYKVIIDYLLLIDRQLASRLCEQECFKSAYYSVKGVELRILNWPLRLIVWIEEHQQGKDFTLEKLLCGKYTYLEIDFSSRFIQSHLTQLLEQYIFLPKQQPLSDLQKQRLTELLDLMLTPLSNNSFENLHSKNKIVNKALVAFGKNHRSQIVDHIKSIGNYSKYLTSIFDLASANHSLLWKVFRIESSSSAFLSFSSSTKVVSEYDKLMAWNLAKQNSPTPQPLAVRHKP